MFIDTFDNSDSNAYGILFFDRNVSLMGFGRFQNLSERVDTSTMPFSDKQHLKQNVNLPPRMMMPATADPIMHTANKQ